MAIYSGFSHWKWWFSIVMLVYQRVTGTWRLYSPFFFRCRAAYQERRWESHVDPVVEAHPVDDMMGSITSWIFQHLCRLLYVYIYICIFIIIIIIIIITIIIYYYYYYILLLLLYIYTYHIHVYNMYIICGDMWRYYEKSDDQLSGCDRMVCYFGTARHPDGILVGWSCWTVIPPQKKGWLVVDLALWKIWKSMGRIIPYIYINIYYGIMENNTCLKPPTRWSS